ncbi:MAG: phospholipase D family protein [bacterium]|nr:phospholipase D family protein [bacterium]
MKKLFSASMLCILSFTLFAKVQTFEANTTYQVTFSPNGQCQQDIINAIDKAKYTILIQAHSFTSTPIAKALVNAKNRGVHVKVILDKSQVTSKYSSTTYMHNMKVSVWVDYRPVSAHNNIMIIDAETVITGSYFFTKNTQENNTENVLIINSPNLAIDYLNYWQKRVEKSMTYKQYKTKKNA